MSGIEVSIIMISHNKYPQNLLTLYSFENQTFDLSKLEVIFVDDHSTDDTIKLKETYRPPYPFTYIHCKETVGRSRAKNIGIDQARGNIIIFLDVEMLVEPNFVEKHYNLHQNTQNLVVSTTNEQKAAFTIYDPNFNQEQLLWFFHVIGRNPSKLISLFHNPNLKNLKQLIRNQVKPQQLLSKEDIKQQLYTHLSYPSPTFKLIVDQFGPELKEFHMPWIFCITRNVSIPRQLIEKAGHFNEAFNGWGCEDNEYGYRLFNLGATFYDAPDIVTYHQEHPFSAEDRKKEVFQNIITFQEIHPEIDVAVLTLPFVHQGSYIVASHVISEYKQLSVDYPEKYHKFKKFIVSSLQEIPKLCITNNDYSIIPFQQTLDQLKNEEKNVLLSEANDLRLCKKNPHLIYFFDTLFKFPTI